jgi:putative transposase
MELFSKEQDYVAFEELLEETLAARPMRICAYCLMPTHWHFVLWPEKDDDLAAFMQQLTTKHVRRWQLHRQSVGFGHVYQGRYKSFPVESEEYFYSVVRYVERNALRAGLVDRAETWKWSSLWRQCTGTSEQRQLLSGWPVPCPRNWRQMANEPMNEAEVETICRCIARGQPYGDDAWIRGVAK